MCLFHYKLVCRCTLSNLVLSRRSNSVPLQFRDIGEFARDWTRLIFAVDTFLRILVLITVGSWDKANTPRLESSYHRNK